MRIYGACTRATMNEKSLLKKAETKKTKKTVAKMGGLSEEGPKREGESWREGRDGGREGEREREREWERGR